MRTARKLFAGPFTTIHTNSLLTCSDPNSGDQGSCRKLGNKASLRGVWGTEKCWVRAQGQNTRQWVWEHKIGMLAKTWRTEICSAVLRKKEKLGLNSEANLDSVGLLQPANKNSPSRVPKLRGGSRITGREEAGRNRLHAEAFSTSSILSTIIHQVFHFLVLHCYFCSQQNQRGNWEGLTMQRLLRSSLQLCHSKVPQHPTLAT